MNVRELIEALQECDPEMDVAYVDPEGIYPEGYGVDEVTQVSYNGSEWIQLG